MQSFTASDLARRTGEIIDAAIRAPVVITRTRRDTVVMIDVDLYHRMVEQIQDHKPQRDQSV